MARERDIDADLNASFLSGNNATFIEEIYARFQQNPNSVDAGWRDFFTNFHDNQADVEAELRGASWKREEWPIVANGELVNALDGNWPTENIASKSSGAKINTSDNIELRKATADSVRALMLIRAYRVRGHLEANLDPLELRDRQQHPELRPETYGFTDEDIDRPIFIDNVLGLEFATLREIMVILRQTYCGSIGVEFMHISDPDQKSWIQERIEGAGKGISFSKDDRLEILEDMIETEGFENFLHVKYTGTKRFGLDGGESIVPALEQIITHSSRHGIKEVVIGMPHRGRLNVLASTMKKPHRAIFNEFMGGSSNPDDIEGSGDVKYHLGASADRELAGNIVHLSLTANPSHLEIVDPVVLGKARAKQLQLKDDEHSKVLPLILHGDAAFAGQGVVAECFGLSDLKGHKTGGSIHFIVNNQIGFTTSPIYARSSPYPSDVAKMIAAPIFHVNGDDPEAVMYAARVAVEFRQKFHKPVVIDMFCYRRFGHNEGDEPSFTQPIMYSKISKHPTTLQIYSDRLIREGVLTVEEFEARKSKFREHLNEEFAISNVYRPEKADWLDGKWSGFEQAKAEGARRGKTGVDIDKLKDIGNKITELPNGFNVHKTVTRIVNNRRQMIETGKNIDWALAEHLAFASLLVDGHHVRLSGQDCERGTFSHRHSVLNDQLNENRYVPLNNIGEGQARYEVINSMLSEEAVLGFEYGFSLAEPNALVMWEAQFGDFANGAQVVVDQFISSGESKWLRMCGLVMLLPHGYEGQGPEHSSARLERYLQLCAEDNMQVANCTTPANYFHILRRQLCRDFRKPLIIMSPKSLLRHKMVISDIEEFGSDTSFHRLLWDDAQLESNDYKLVDDKEIKKVILCSGKVYYDLYDERSKRKINNVYLLRVEQLYPFPSNALKKELSRFAQAEIIWCQEEPKNMGSWFYIGSLLEDVLNSIELRYKRAKYVGRAAAASPAAGSFKRHAQELEKFLNEAFANI